MNIFKLFGEVAVNGVDKAKSELNGLADTGQKVSSKMGTVCTKIGDGIVKMAKVGVAGITAASAGITALTKTAVENYAEFEQLVGGVETLFKDSANKVMEYANGAYKSAGLSANAYMETVTSFSASLLQSLGGDTAQATEMANMAIVDMADNANKMGTSISMIQNAYQGFAKQNYTMLDNLKLGYGGTATEMARLVNESGVLGDNLIDLTDTKYIGEALQEVGFAKIIEAIHIVQTQMGITGTTAKEASSTIQGSFMAMKSAWTNLVTGMADPSQDFGALVGNMVDSAVTVMDNLVPVIIAALPKVVEGITQLVKSLVPYIPTLLGELIPVAIDALTTLITVTIDELPNILEKLLGSTGKRIGTIFQNLFKSLGSTLKNIMPMLNNLAATVLPPLLDIAEQLLPMLVEIISMVLPVLIEFISALLPPLLEVVQMALPVLMDLLRPLLDLLKPLLDFLQPILAVLIQLLKPLIELVNIILVPLIELFSALVAVILNNFYPAIQNIATLIKQDLLIQLAAIKPILDVIKAAFALAVDYIKEKFSPIVNFFSGIWDGIKGAFGSVADWFGNEFHKAWERVKAVFSTGGQIFNGIKEGISGVFKKVVNGLITGINTVLTVPFNTINGMLNKIRGISILNVSPFANLWGENPLAIPQIPHLETGAVLEKGQVGLLEGNAAEAVVPLDKNQKWLRALGKDMQAEFGLGNNQEIVSKLDKLIAVIQQLRIYLYGDVLVGELAPAINTALGDISLATERGH